MTDIHASKRRLWSTTLGLPAFISGRRSEGSCRCSQTILWSEIFVQDTFLLEDSLQHKKPIHRLSTLRPGNNIEPLSLPEWSRTTGLKISNHETEASPIKKKTISCPCLQPSCYQQRKNTHNASQSTHNNQVFLDVHETLPNLQRPPTLHALPSFSPPSETGTYRNPTGRFVF